MPYRLLPATFPSGTKPAAIPILLVVVVVALVAAIALRLSTAPVPAYPASVPAGSAAGAPASGRVPPDSQTRDATVRRHLDNARSQLLEASDQVQRAHRQAVIIATDLDHWPYQTDRRRANGAAQACSLALDELERALEEVQTASVRKEE